MEADTDNAMTTESPSFSIDTASSAERQTPAGLKATPSPASAQWSLSLAQGEDGTGTDTLSYHADDGLPRYGGAQSQLKYESKDDSQTFRAGRRSGSHTGESSPSISNQSADPTDETGKEVPNKSNGNAASATETGQPAKPENPVLGKDDVVNDTTGNLDDADSNILSPPPDSISPVSDRESESEVLNEGPEDEIVVGSVKKKSAGANNPALPSEQSALPSEDSVNQDAMDVDVEDEELEVQEEIDLEPQERPKRKRASIYEDLDVDKMDSSMLGDKFDDFADSVPDVPVVQEGVPVKPSTSEKAVPLGVWRESEAPDPDKHVVKGFIDSRDRLRTRIQNHNREGKNVTLAYPLKPGPGGSWVTFHNIIFDNHLLNLDQIQVKEYVKIRAEMMKGEKEDQKKENDTAAVGKAIKICNARGPPPENVSNVALLPLIAYGAVIPESARIQYGRAEKRRRNNAGKIVASSSTPDLPPIIPQGHHIQPALKQPSNGGFRFPEDLHGYRPTKILLGFWKESAEKDDVDKHAVFGILGNNDMFRVKVGRETRDGRHLQSNFPSGAGALWINTHQWQCESFLDDLTRDEIKEFCRVRQWQIDHGLRDTYEPHAIAEAINEARHRVARMPSKAKPGHGPPLSAGNQFTDAILTHQPPPPPPPPTHETRQTLARRSGPAITPAPSSRDSPQTPGFRAANRPTGLDGAHDPRMQRADSLASHAVSRIEASQAKVEERDAYASGANGHGGSFRENLGRLNNVWSQQEAQRIRSGNEDAKIHMGVKYERKQNGPFSGKLVSQGAIISIDGEDYVEYRVLTKPTFI